MAAAQQRSYNLKNIIEQSIDYLRSRHHPEKPHISVLSPPPIPIAMKLWQGIIPQCQPSISGEEEEEEEDVEEFIEEFYSSRNPGHIFGVDLLNADLGSGGISFTFSFYVRTSYDSDNESMWREDAYTKVTINGMVDRGANKITYNVEVEPGDPSKQEWAPSMLNIPLEIPINNDCLITSLILLPLNQQESQQFVGKYVRYVFGQVASINLPRGYAERHFVLNVGSGGAYSLGSNITAVPIGTLDSNPWMSLRGKVYDKSGNPAGYYYPAFGIVLGLCKAGDNYVVKSYLVNLGGVLRTEDPSYKGEAVNDYCRRYWVFTWNKQEEEGTRWALGHLLEVEGRVEALYGARLNVRWDAEKGGLLNAHVYNAMLICEDDTCSKGRLVDYHIEEEVLPPIKRSIRKVKDYFEYLLSRLNINDDCKRKLSPLFDALANVLSSNYGVHELYEYQEQAIEEILASQGLINKGAKDRIVITARTAGGKTFAFLIPAIIVSAYRKLCRGEGVGVKAVLMYPTKALANDQVEEVAHMLYYLHENLKNLELTFGVLHGNIKHKAELQKLQQTQQQKMLLPMYCPLDGEPVEYDISSGVVICNKGGSSCPFASFVSKYMRITRDDIYGEPPDILITDEDMMNRILSGVGSGPPYWFEWSILGSPYKRCPYCGFTYPLNWKGKKCVQCGKAINNNIKVINNVSKPSLIVLDEAHMLTGSFGAQVHHMLSLLEYVMNKLSSTMRHKITYVMASATMGNPEEFAASIFGVGRGDVKVIQAEVERVEIGTEKGKGGHRRYFAFVMPKAYTRDATTVRLIASFIREYKNAVNSVPKGVIFTNFLDESNELLHSLKMDEEIKQAIVPDRIGGHSTDYEEERVEVENRFKRGDLDVLVATSTLELGIDYGVIDFVAIYGMPNTLTSYIQRIGRAGRKRDAVVFTIFDPERRIDYYFFENYKLLSDGKMREAALKRETYPVGASNEEAVRRAVRRFVTAAVKLCCVMDNNCPGSNDACHAIINGIKSNRVQDFWSFMANYLYTLFSNNDIPSSIINLRSIPLIQSVINNEIEQIRQKITQNTERRRNLSNLINVLGGDEALYNLRAADITVVFEFKKLGMKRYRELRYAIKHALPGQVVSYRGYFFAATGSYSYNVIRNRIGEFFAEV